MDYYAPACLLADIILVMEVQIRSPMPSATLAQAASDGWPGSTLNSFFLFQYAPSPAPPTHVTSLLSCRRGTIPAQSPLRRLLLLDRPRTAHLRALARQGGLAATPHKAHLPDAVRFPPSPQVILLQRRTLPQEALFPTADHKEWTGNGDREIVIFLPSVCDRGGR